MYCRPDCEKRMVTACNGKSLFRNGPAALIWSSGSFLARFRFPIPGYLQRIVTLQRGPGAGVSPPRALSRAAARGRSVSTTVKTTELIVRTSYRLEPTYYEHKESRDQSIDSVSPPSSLCPLRPVRYRKPRHTRRRRRRPIRPRVRLRLALFLLLLLRRRPPLSK